MATLLVTLSLYGAQDNSVSRNGPASRSLTTLVSCMALARSTGRHSVFGCSGRLLCPFQVHARELQVKLLPVGSLPERADGLPEPLLCSLDAASQVTRSYRDKRDRRGGRGEAAACKDVRTHCGTHQHPQFPVDRMGGGPGPGYLAGWAAFDSNRNLWTKMESLSFYETDKNEVPNQFSLVGGENNNNNKQEILQWLNPPPPQEGRKVKSKGIRSKL